MPLTVLNVGHPFAPVGSDSVGGAEQILGAIDEALVAAGERSLVLACAGSRVHGELIEVGPAPGPFTTECQAASNQRFAARLRDILTAEPVDLVHYHGSDFLAYQARSGPPALCTLHLPLAWYGPAVFAPQPEVYLHCVSASQRRAGPAGARLLDDIPNGVDLARFRPALRPARSYALMLGRICPEKGIHLGIEACRRAGIDLLVGGAVFPYPEHERYFAAEVAPRLGPRSRFLGPVGMPAKADLLAGAHCLLVPSLAAETSSLVAMEALACGTPVVAFRRGALPDIVEAEATGILVQAGNIDGLADGVRRAAAMDRTRCRRVAEQRFSAAAMCSRYLGLYRRLTGASGRWLQTGS
jgi:glycosyltransferase involved in cell wall biosynthesis